jgi:hypothetical protein
MMGVHWEYRLTMPLFCERTSEMIIERPMNASPRRFSLRTLFLVVTIVAVLLFMKWH